MEPETFNINQVISELRGVGISELETPLDFPTPSGIVKLTISNISTEKEIESIIASEDFKGHHWMQRIKSEILSRAVTSVNGFRLADVTDPYVTDPSNPEKTIPLRAAIRNQFLSWGPEALQLAWKIYMVHCQNLEDRLFDSFPDATVMTEYEQKFFERTLRAVDEFNREMMEELSDSVSSEEVEAKSE
jgi:hypothetical protein